MRISLNVKQRLHVLVFIFCVVVVMWGSWSVLVTRRRGTRTIRGAHPATWVVISWVVTVKIRYAEIRWVIPLIVMRIAVVIILWVITVTTILRIVHHVHHHHLELLLLLLSCLLLTLLLHLHVHHHNLAHRRFVSICGLFHCVRISERCKGCPSTTPRIISAVFWFSTLIRSRCTPLQILLVGGWRRRARVSISRR